MVFIHNIHILKMSLSIGIESANIITYTSLDIHNDSCPICRCSLMEKCLDCSNIDELCECTSILGVCGHGYHLHCISTWLKTKQMCPLDNNRWEFKKHNNCSNCIKKKKTQKNINNTEPVNNTESVNNDNLSIATPDYSDDESDESEET